MHQTQQQQGQETTEDQLMPNWESRRAHYRVIFGAELPIDAAKKQARIELWQTELTRFCRVYNRFHFTIQELEESFARPLDESSGTLIRPRGLAKIFEERPDWFVPALNLSAHAQRVNGELLQGPVGWGSWLFSSLVLAPAKLALSSLTRSSSTAVEKSTRVCFIPVLRALLDEKRDLIMTSSSSSSSLSLSLSSSSTTTTLISSSSSSLSNNPSLIQDSSSSSSLFDDGIYWLEPDLLSHLERVLQVPRPDAQIFLQFMVSERQAVILESEREPRGVKLLLNGQTVNREVDQGLIAIKVQTATLERVIARIEAEIDRLTKLALNHKQRGDTDSALRCLRERAGLRKLLGDRENVLQNFRQLHISLQTAESTGAILSALQSGNAALQAMQQQTPIHAITETLANVEDTLEIQRELEQALTQNIVPPEDESILEEEFLSLTTSTPAPLVTTTPALVTTSTASPSSPTISSLLPTFPSVPTELPTISPITNSSTPSLLTNSSSSIPILEGL